jgi:hypothetical protein
MFVAFHVDAYFSLYDEMPLYFILCIAIIQILNMNQIQISFFHPSGPASLSPQRYLRPMAGPEACGNSSQGQ